MIELQGLRLTPGEKETRLRRAAAKKLHIAPEQIRTLKILKKSLDARKKSDIHWLYTVAVEAAEPKLLAACPAAKRYVPFVYEIPRAASENRPVVVGFGPAGMFAALLLAEAGLRPLVLERGADVDTRRQRVQDYWAGGALDEAANVQFGEGGAGTFSDGKLATGTHDSRIPFVLAQLHRFGAPERVLYDAKPHVGTDILAGVVKNLRRRVTALGGELRFLTRFTGFEQDGAGVSAALAETPAGETLRIPCRDLILAPGHSARDTFVSLHAAGLPMERKPFAMGVRIEQRQRDVSRAQYGAAWEALPAADYKLNAVLPDGSSAFTFCMCPGGYVVAAASEAGGVCTNGMSYSGRGGENANAALLVTLKPEDFPGEGVLAGMYWQREIERRCFVAGGGSGFAPAQRVGDFLGGVSSVGPGQVNPTYRPGVTWCDLHAVLPEKLTGTLAGALPLLGKKLQGFDAPDAVLTAPETRSSSPVRILRDSGTLCSPAAAGLYPCGEGAGYAGGITSAAVDGMRAAERIIEKYRL